MGVTPFLASSVPNFWLRANFPRKMTFSTDLVVHHNRVNVLVRMFVSDVLKILARLAWGRGTI